MSHSIRVFFRPFEFTPSTGWQNWKMAVFVPVNNDDQMEPEYTIHKQFIDGLDIGKVYQFHHKYNIGELAGFRVDENYKVTTITRDTFKNLTQL